MPLLALHNAAHQLACDALCVHGRLAHRASAHHRPAAHQLACQVLSSPALRYALLLLIKGQALAAAEAAQCPEQAIDRVSTVSKVRPSRCRPPARPCTHAWPMPTHP